MKNIFSFINNNIRCIKLSHRYFSISVALVGYPNVGKSTFFNALVKRQLAEARNLPFCTIEPNIAKVEAVDETLLELSRITNNHTIKAFNIEVMDVAGLIKDSMKPDGQGVQFLHCLRQATAIIQIVRCFKDSQVTYMDDNLNPLNEIEIVQTELILSDIEVIDRKLSKGGKKTTPEEKALLEKLKDELNSGKLIRHLDFKSFTDDQRKFLDTLNLISIKPFVYVFNVDPPEVENEYTQLLKEQLINETYVVTSCVLENEALQLADGSPIMESLDIINSYFETYPNFKFQSWALVEKIIKKLNFVTFYSVGETATNQSWIIRKGANIVDAAGLIHSDFAKRFICAEISTYEDWKKYKNEEGVKNAKKMITVGRDYIVKDGDIVNIKFRQ
jgi:GTP-binding protein YchF